MDVVATTSTFDNTTVRLEIFSSVLASAAPGSSHTMTVTVTYAGGSWNQAITVTAVAPSSSITTVRTIELYGFT